MGAVPSFHLRPWRMEDVESFVRYCSDPHVRANMFDDFQELASLDKARGFLAGCISAGSDKMWARAIDAGGEAVGSIALIRGTDAYRKSAAIAYWLGRPFWGRGIMSEAVRQICRMAFDSTDLVRISAQPFSTNPASCRVLEKAGFTLEGCLRKSVYKNGQSLDSLLFALVR